MKFYCKLTFHDIARVHTIITYQTILLRSLNFRCQIFIFM